MNIVEKLAGSTWKKLMVWIITMLLVVLRDDLGLDTEQIVTLTGGSGLFHIGQGLADFGKGKTLAEETLKKKAPAKSKS